MIMWKNLAELDNRYKFWGVMVISAVVRFLKIGSRPIWYDEAIAILRANKGLNAIIQGTLGTNVTGRVPDVHPPGYFLSLYGWMELFGDSIPTARIMSVLFGLLAIWIVYLLFKFTVGDNYAWLGALMVGISPFHVHYSQEIRMYSLMTFALLLATYSLFRGMDDRRWHWWAIFAVSSAGAQYTQQLSAVYLLALAGIPILRRDLRSALRTLVAGLGAIVLYFPWLIHLPEQFASTNVYWVQKPMLSRFLTLFLAFVAGLPVQSIWLWVGFALSLFLVVFAIVGSVRIIRDPESKKIGMWFAYLAFAPPVLLWLISQYRPVYIERALLPSAVMFTVWVAWLVVDPKTPKLEKYLLTGLFVVGSIIGFSTHLTYEGFSYARFEEIGNSIESRRLENEVIVHSNKLTFVPMFYFFGNDIPQQFVGDVEGSSTDTLHPITQGVLGFQEADLESAVEGAEGVWFIIFQRAINEAEDMGFETHPHLEWLDARFELIGEELWGDLWVMHYQKTDQ